MSGRTESYISQEHVSGLFSETMSLSLLLFPTPIGMGMHLSFNTTM